MQNTVFRCKERLHSFFIKLFLTLDLYEQILLMNQSDAIINPVKGKKAPDLGHAALMVSSETDLQTIIRLTDISEDKFKPLMMSRIYVGKDVSLTGPVVSAPYAVMLLETLIAWGAKRFIFFGWCGAILPDVQIGDIILPAGAFIDEGTSRHYQGDENEIAHPSSLIVENTREILRNKGIKFHEGTIWTIDAIYRETLERVEYFQAKHVLGVEMELSALFTVAKFRNVDLGGILVVSDELSNFTWKPGFKDERFKQSRMTVAEILSEFSW